MEIDGTKIVKEIVLAMPSSAKVFEQLEIDHCCGGDKRLDEACRAAGREIYAHSTGAQSRFNLHAARVD